MFKNILWDIIGKFGSQIISFIISIILTRLLQPEEYGIMGMAMVVIGFAHVFLDLGFNRAIIQKKDTSAIQLASVFYLNTFVAFILTIACYFIASPLSIFYNQPLIKPVFRVLSISFLLNGLNLVPSSILYKKFQYKLNSILVLIASLLSGIVGVLMAYNGFGVWSLVAQSLISSFLIMVLNFIYAKWTPLFSFSMVSIAPLWKYGSRMFASGVLDTLYNRLDIFIIGKIFTPATLGYYARAQSMDNLVRQFSATSIIGALFPYIARHQDDKVFLKELYFKYLHTIAFVSVALSGLLFLIAPHLFTILFTSRWEYSAELFQLLAIAGFIWPVSALMCNIIAGVGNSVVFLRLEVYKKLLALPVYIFGFLLGLKGFIICMVIVGLVCLYLNAFFVAKEIETNIFKQLRLLTGYIFLGILSCFVAWLLLHYLSQFYYFNEIFSLGILSLTFSICYILGAYNFKMKGTDVINVSFQKIKFAFQ